MLNEDMGESGLAGACRDRLIAWGARTRAAKGAAIGLSTGCWGALAATGSGAGVTPVPNATASAMSNRPIC